MNYSSHHDNLIIFMKKHFDKIIDITNLEKYISELTPSELAICFKELWKYLSRRNFCDTYNINERNFSRWLNGKKNSEGCCKAVRSFLVIGPNEKILNIPVQSINKINTTSNLLTGSNEKIKVLQILIMINMLITLKVLN